MNTERIAISVSTLKVNTATHYLNEAGIECFVMNKMDSAHPMVFGGYIEIYVNKEDVERAKALLDQEGLLD